MKVPQEPPVQRLSFRYLIDQVLQVLNLERGIGYTIKWMVLNPRKAIQQYLFEDRKRMVKPLSFVVLIAAITTYLTVTFIFQGDELLNQLHADPDWEEVPENLKPIIDKLLIISQKYFNLSYLSTIPLLSFATFLVFKESGLNLTEHLVINSYLYCMQSFFIILIIPFLVWLPQLGAILAIPIFGYLIYAYASIFELKWLEAVGKVLLVYVIYGTFSSVLLSILVIALMR